MMMFRSFCARFVLCATVVSFASSAAMAAEVSLEPAPLGDIAIAPNTEVFELENGLTLVVIPDHRAPVVTHMVVYKVGSADEPQGKSGIAHLLEHLMFKGTVDQPGGFSERIHELGGQQNAFTSFDQTAYFQRIAKEHLPEMMALEADRMTNLVVTEELTKPELSVVLKERLTRVDAEPSARLGETMSATLFVESAYGRPIIGWETELKALNHQDAIDFYDRFYSPNNAIVVVAGDVEPVAVLTAAKATYGQVAQRVAHIDRYRAWEPEPHAARTVELSDPQVTQASVRRAWVVPSYMTSQGNGEAETLDVLATVLGGGSGSVLHDILVRDRKRALNVGAGYNGNNMGADSFSVFGIPAEGVTPEELIADIQTIIDELAQSGITQAAVDFNVRRKLASAIYAQDSQRALARIFGSGLAVGSSVEQIQDWPDRVQQVSLEGVLAAAAKYLKPHRAVTGYLKPGPAQN